MSNHLYNVTKNGTTITLTPKTHKIKQTLIFLPGWAESAATWVPYFLTGNSTPEDTKIVLLTAPIRFNKLYGRKGLAWFETFSLNFSQEDPNKVFNVEHADDSVEIVTKIVDNEVEELGDSKCCFIGGFSAGGSMASMVWKRYKKPLGGLVLYSATTFKATEMTKEQENSSVFWAHGLDDILVLYEHCIYNNKSLEDGKRRYVHVTREGLGHGVDNIVELETKRFLEDLMAKSKL